MDAEGMKLVNAIITLFKIGEWAIVVLLALSLIGVVILIFMRDR